MLRTGPLPTAVVAFNDSCAVGAIEEFDAAGVRVPDDLSITGYDDSALARLRRIDLTSVRQDVDQLGRWAVSAAVERLDHGRAEAREAVLVPQLIVRGSSMPLR